jgi:hypothetical protein
MSSRSLSLLIAVPAACLAMSGCAVYEGNMVVQPQSQLVAVETEGQVIGETPVAAGTNTTVYVDTDPSALTDFREPLSPYGTWVDDGNYGTVWMPRAEVVGANFQPYVSSGHWTYDSEYVWVSDYSWGWAPFHYGRWVYLAGRGWAWIPGRTYSGAWVSWRTGGPDYGYVGWAPMAPSWYWYNGYAVGLGVVPPTPYVFCERGHVFHNDVGRRIVQDSGQIQVIGSATRPFIPASPTVNQHTAASPTVASAGSTLSSTRMAAAPTPQSLGYASPPRAATEHAGLLQARSFATPASAQTFGGRPPSVSLGSRIDAVATAPRYEGIERRATQPAAIAPGVPRMVEAPRPMERAPSFAPREIPAPQREVRVTPPAVTYAAPPSYSRPSPPTFAAPAPRSAPVQMQRSEAPSFRAAPSVQQQPSFRAPAPTPNVSRPSLRRR